jgi:hypothetical protein
MATIYKISHETYLSVVFVNRKTTFEKKIVVSETNLSKVYYRM